MGTGGEFRPPSGFLPTGDIGVCCSTLHRTFKSFVSAGEGCSRDGIGRRD